jgi:HlyD family secretion protein
LSVSQRASRRELGAGLLTRQRVVPLVLGLLVVLLVFLIAHDVFFPATPAGAAVSTATVTRGTVRSAVTATGTVVPIKQQAVNFASSGTLAEVDVNVGDHVAKGQTLGRLDTIQLQQALDQANNGLIQSQSSLNNTVNGNAIQQAQHGLANAQQSLSDTQAQVNLTNQQDQNALATDRAQLDADNLALTAAQAAVVGVDCTVAQPPQPCARLTSAQQAVTQDNSRIALDNNKIALDKLSGQRSINQATNAVTQAQDQLNAQTIQRPNTIASQQAAVSNAQLAVNAAQRNLDNATLEAPFDGTVLAINNQVGDTVSGGGSATSSASSAQSSASGGGGGGSNSSSSSASSSGGFIQLGDLSGFEITAPFAEADAARVQANQQATVTFDAITGLTLPAHVLSMAQVATVVSNVTNYSATLVLDQVDQRLRSGMTANADVVVQNAQNVLTLPNSVISRIGTASFVTLLGRDGRQTRTPVQTGAVGDTTTEVRSGLNEGDRVVRPQLRTGTGTGGAGGAGGLGGGAGRGGFGGGGGVRISG